MLRENCNSVKAFSCKFHEAHVERQYFYHDLYIIETSCLVNINVKSVKLFKVLMTDHDFLDLGVHNLTTDTAVAVRSLL